MNRLRVLVLGCACFVFVGGGCARSSVTSRLPWMAKKPMINAESYVAQMASDPKYTLDAIAAEPSSVSSTSNETYSSRSTRGPSSSGGNCSSGCCN